MTPPPDTPDERPRGGCDCLPRPDAAAAPAEAAAPPTFAIAPEAAATAFVLRYEDRWFGFEKRVAFAADDVAAAIEMMEHEPTGRWAELWHEGQLVCRRTRAEGAAAADYWTVD